MWKGTLGHVRTEIMNAYAHKLNGAYIGLDFPECWHKPLGPYSCDSVYCCNVHLFCFITSEADTDTCCFALK